MVFLMLCFQEDLTKETLLKQFKIVKSHTNTSHVQQYGNKVRENGELPSHYEPNTCNFFLFLLLVNLSSLTKKHFGGRVVVF